jgi:hypothetical protein
LPVADYLRRAEDDAYPYRLEEAITLSLRAVEDRDQSGVHGSVAEASSRCPDEFGQVIVSIWPWLGK